VGVVPFARLATLLLLLAPAARSQEPAPTAAVPAGAPPAAVEVPEPAASEPTVASIPWDLVNLLGQSVAPGDRRRLSLSAGESFAGDAVDIPVLVIRGTTPGPTLCFVAGVHGDELNGIEIVRKVFEEITPRDLSGMLIGVPVANVHGLRRSSRYLPDQRDLNRFFPGHPGGSSASRIANALFEGIVEGCDGLVDFHTGSFQRTNLPQVRGDLRIPRVLELAKGFGTGEIVHSEGRAGTLRRAASDAGIPAVTFEAGEPLRFQAKEIERGAEGVRGLLASWRMVPGGMKRKNHRVYYRSRWLRVNDGGIFLTQRKLGDAVKVGDVLGTVTDPVTNERGTVIAPFPGRIIGMAVPQVVIPGFAAFHIGVEAPAKPEPVPVVESPEELPESPEELSGPAPESLPEAPAVVPPPNPEQLDPEEAPE
jgi:predicted deacylase